MKKSKFLALALSAAVMMMGAGYAAWTETATISHTVSTGELSIALQAGGSVHSWSNPSATIVDDQYAVGDVVVDSSDDNKANVTLRNLYPGAVVKVSVPIKNDGTIPAKETGVVSPDLNAYPWLSVTELQAPDNLAVDEVGNITYTVSVDPEASDDIELQTVNFDIVANYGQFNR